MYTWHSAHGDLHICEGTINAKGYVGILERYMLPSIRQLFPGTPCPPVVNMPLSQLFLSVLQASIFTFVYI